MSHLTITKHDTQCPRPRSRIGTGRHPKPDSCRCRMLVQRRRKVSMKTMCDTRRTRIDSPATGVSQAKV